MLFYDENNQLIDIRAYLRNEQSITSSFLHNDAYVLEIGGEYGVITKTIYDICHNVITIERNPILCDQLRGNLKLNQIDQYIKIHDVVSGTPEYNNNFIISNVQKIYNIKFDTIIYNYMHGLYDFFENNPEIYDLKLVIVKCGFHTTPQFNIIKTKMETVGFICVWSGQLSYYVWIKKDL